MRTTGSTMSRFDKQRAVKSLGMPHSRRDNAVRGTMSRFDKQRAVKSLGMPHSRRANAVRDKYFVFFMVFDIITTIK